MSLLFIANIEAVFKKGVIQMSDSGELIKMYY